MNKIKALIALWLKLKPVVEIRVEKEVVKEIKERVVIKNATKWNLEHAKGLHTFLNSHVGKIALENMDATEVTVNAWAVSSLSGTHETREFRAGVAHGIAVAHNKFRRMADCIENSENEEATPEELDAIIQDRLNNY